ncbi:MAG: DUF2892 domain-containing protein [Gemmatimonadaceae bacterium]|nr:DUF2892 domain-containing protein [Gemmatimonadaceae bacterium]
MSNILKQNVGSIDRIGRLVLGAGLLSLTVIGPQTAWGYLGLVPLLTGAMGSCPLYTLFGFSSCPVKRA